MPTYSYIPPEYRTKSKKSVASSNTPLASQQAMACVDKEPRIAYRDTGTTGKSIFGQAPSWKYKPLPPLPHEKTDQSPSKLMLSKFKNQQCDAVSTMERAGANAEPVAQRDKTMKGAKNFSRILTSIASKI